MHIRKVGWLPRMVLISVFFAWRIRCTKIYPIKIQISSFDGQNKGDLLLFKFTHKTLWSMKYLSYCFAYSYICDICRFVISRAALLRVRKSPSTSNKNLVSPKNLRARERKTVTLPVPGIESCPPSLFTVCTDLHQFLYVRQHNFLQTFLIAECQKMVE